MQELKLQYVDFACDNDSMDAISLYLESQEKHSLKYIPWTDFPYKPEVEFALAYSSDHILLKYYVNEKSIRAVNTGSNTPVYEDSCVEFFVSFDEKGYYNLEFNCLGASLVGFGPGREDRKLLDEQTISGIKYQSVIRNQKPGSVNWELTLAIPLSTFVYHELTSLKGKSIRGNFYKCGDALPEPHFVAWSNIESDIPNFHLPQFFGALNFEPKNL